MALRASVLLLSNYPFYLSTTIHTTYITTTLLIHTISILLAINSFKVATSHTQSKNSCAFVQHVFQVSHALLHGSLASSAVR